MRYFQLLCDLHTRPVETELQISQSFHTWNFNVVRRPLAGSHLAGGACEGEHRGSFRLRRPGETESGCVCRRDGEAGLVSSSQQA